MRYSRKYRQEDAATISLNPIHLEHRWRRKLAEAIYDVSVSSCFQSFATVSAIFNIIS
jgi:Leu/Phe-tRNA-protein transferase